MMFLPYLYLLDILLSIKIKSEVFIPNHELLVAFSKTVKNCNWSIISDVLKESDDLLKATLDMNESKVCEIIGRIHYELSSSFTYNNENSLSCVILNAYFTARRIYAIFRELPLGVGFADFVFIHLRGILFELKWNQDADTAIKQIENKKYSEHLSKYIDDLIFAAVNYDISAKKHECKIFKYKKP